MILEQNMLFLRTMGLGLVISLGILSILGTNGNGNGSGDVNHICTPVEDKFTEFMGTHVNGNLLKNLALLPSANDVNKARITAHGSNTTATFSASWGLEVTSAFLLDHCGLNLGAAARTDGVVDNDPGGSVSVKYDSFVYIYRASGVALSDVLNSGISPIHDLRTFPYGGRVKVDTTPGLHTFGEFEDSVSVEFLDNGAFITIPGVSSTSVFPDYTLQVGDKIIVGSWMEFDLQNSAIQFELNNVGQTTISGWLNHSKWR